MSQNNHAGFRSLLPDDIDWKPFPAFPPEVRLAIINGMVRRFYRASWAVIRGGGGVPWNYTPSALILVRQFFIW